MAIEILVDKKRDRVMATTTGQVTADELTGSFLSILKHPDYHPDMPILVDMSGTVHSLSAQDIRAMADSVLAADPAVMKGVREAIVVSKTASYGMVRMFQSYIERSGMRLGVFYSVADAEKWLEI